MLSRDRLSTPLLSVTGDLREAEGVCPLRKPASFYCEDRLVVSSRIYLGRSSLGQKVGRYPGEEALGNVQ